MPPLSTLHRSLVALTALQLGYGPRAVVLASYQVTEEDLFLYRTDWERLQTLRAVERPGSEPDSSRRPPA